MSSSAGSTGSTGAMPPAGSDGGATKPLLKPSASQVFPFSCPQQPDHAVIMVEFARDCMNKMKYATKVLEDRLGPDVLGLDLDLDFHVGFLHSEDLGPVTIGVIRGDKSRFQLFGDILKTAA
jgi:hypothetical protein